MRSLFDLREKQKMFTAICAALLLAGTVNMNGQSLVCDRTWTSDADFNTGILVNVNHNAPNGDQLQLNQVITPFPFINIACSIRGTMVRVNVNTGQILGEYSTAPLGRGKDPSRTTVDMFGNVWVSNRNETVTIDGVEYGSCVKIGLVIGGTRCNADGTPNATGQYLAPPFDYCTAVDRNGDGLIKTSMGLGNILPWPNVSDGTPDVNGIVADAEDECILLYMMLPGAPGARHISIDGANNPWVGGYPYALKKFHKLDQNTGAILATIDAAAIGCGGYGGLIDGHNVLWSSSFSHSKLLRYDLATNTATCITHTAAYGLGIDPAGNIWNGSYSLGTVTKYAPDGTVLGTYSTGGINPRGVAVTSNGDVWIANSGSNNVVRLTNAGAPISTIPVGSMPTGVAVDANGKVWVTNYSSNSASRIDPAAGGGLGAVDLTVSLGSSAGPYNYSDMTGYVLFNNTAPQGTWNVVHNGGIAGVEWGKVSWNASTPTGTGLVVHIRAANTAAALALQPWTPVQNGISICSAPVTGQFAEIRVTLSRNVQFATPVLYDLSLQCCNHPPVAICKNVTVQADATCLGTAVPADVNNGSYDPDGDPITLSMTPAGPFALGSTPVLLTATDDKGAYGTCNAIVTVEDVTPPLITPAVSPVLWPANHQYQTFTVTDLVAAVSDNCDQTLDPGDVVIVSADSDEPENAPGNGDGNTQDDIVIAPGCKQINLRAERAGGGNGRVYTVHLALTDASLVTGTMDVQVFVPHSASSTAIMGAAMYSESCASPKSRGVVTTPETYALQQNYPNPFNPSTTVQFTIPQSGRVILSVYDSYSRLVRALVDEELGAGTYAIPFDARTLASGVYSYRLEVNGVVLSKLMTLAK